MIGQSLQNAINKIIIENPATTFLVAGDSLRGDILSYKYQTIPKIIFVRDCMAVGTAAPIILSQGFISLRTEALNNPFVETSTIENYEEDCVLPLRKLLETIHSEIVLIYHDCYLSQIWQLTMQAYIEQVGAAGRIKRICFYDDFKSGFCVSCYDEIPVGGTHEAYCQIVCRHEVTDLSKYLITKEAVECYLNINSSTGSFYRYICEVGSQFDNPYKAYGVFLRDYPEWGLGEDDYMKIAMQALSQETKHEETVKKWRSILKLR